MDTDRDSNSNSDSCANSNFNTGIYRSPERRGGNSNRVQGRVPSAACRMSAKNETLMFETGIGKGRICRNSNQEEYRVEIVSVRVNGQEKDWDTEGEIVRVHDLVNDINLLEIAAMIPADFTWTGEKKNVILTYNVF